MSRKWTPEERAKQAEAIKRWKPWLASTGPRSATGKEASSRNADKGGDAGKAIRLAQALRELNEAIDKVKRLSGSRSGACLAEVLSR